MVNNILVPLDRSDTAEQVSDWVAKFALSLNAKVTLLAVVDPNWLRVLEPIGNGRRFDTAGGSGIVTAVGMTVGAQRVPPATSHREIEPGFGNHAIDEAVQTAHGYLTARKKTIEATGIDVETEVRIGDPATHIRLTATDKGADLIVMATHRETAASRGILGSVTDRVVRTAGVPVMAIHPAALESLRKSERAIESVIVPLDGSDESETAVPLALEIATAAGAKVVFLSAVKPRFFGFFRNEDIAELRRTELEVYLEKFTAQAAPAGIEASGMVREGDPDEVIDDVVANHEGSIVVMSSHGASGFKRMLIGSVADKVIRTSHRPVVIVRRQEHEQDEDVIVRD